MLNGAAASAGPRPRTSTVLLAPGAITNPAIKPPEPPATWARAARLTMRLGGCGWAGSSRAAIHAANRASPARSRTWLAKGGIWPAPRTLIRCRRRERAGSPGTITRVDGSPPLSIREPLMSPANDSGTAARASHEPSAVPPGW